MDFINGMLGGFVGGGPMASVPPTFQRSFKVFSGAFLESVDLGDGDKIVLPPSALHELAQMHVQYPMLFRLQAGESQTHVGVLEFSAEEGRCYAPHWVMDTLHISEGAIVNVTNVSLPKGTFVKFQPETKDFLELADHRSVFEFTLRKFSCLSKGGVIQITHAGRPYRIGILELKPADAVSIVETDIKVEFAPPLDYDSSEERAKYAAQKALEAAKQAEEDQYEIVVGKTASGKTKKRKVKKASAIAAEAAAPAIATSISGRKLADGAVVTSSHGFGSGGGGGSGSATPAGEGNSMADLAAARRARLARARSLQAKKEAATTPVTHLTLGGKTRSLPAETGATAGGGGGSTPRTASASDSKAPGLTPRPSMSVGAFEGAGRRLTD